MLSVLVTAPATPSGYVISLAEAKTQCRVDLDEHAEDSLLLRYIAAAQAEVENVLGRALTSQVWRLPLDTFPSGSNPIMVPRPPLVSLDSITYYDSNNDQQNLTGYVLDSLAAPALVYPPETGWPATYDRAHPAVDLQYTCGHGDSNPVDANIVEIVLMLVGRSYAHREATITGAIATELQHVYSYLLGHPYRDHTDYSGQV